MVIWTRMPLSLLTFEVIFHFISINYHANFMELELDNGNVLLFSFKKKKSNEACVVWSLCLTVKSCPTRRRCNSIFLLHIVDIKQSVKVSSPIFIVGGYLYFCHRWWNPGWNWSSSLLIHIKRTLHRECSSS